MPLPHDVDYQLAQFLPSPASKGAGLTPMHAYDVVDSTHYPITLLARGVPGREEGVDVYTFGLDVHQFTESIDRIGRPQGSQHS